MRFLSKIRVAFFLLLLSGILVSPQVVSTQGEINFDYYQVPLLGDKLNYDMLTDNNEILLSDQVQGPSYSTYIRTGVIFSENGAQYIYPSDVGVDSIVNLKKNTNNQMIFNGNTHVTTSSGFVYTKTGNYYYSSTTGYKNLDQYYVVRDINDNGLVVGERINELTGGIEVTYWDEVNGYRDAFNAYEEGFSGQPYLLNNQGDILMRYYTHTYPGESGFGVWEESTSKFYPFSIDVQVEHRGLTVYGVTLTNNGIAVGYYRYYDVNLAQYMYNSFYWSKDEGTVKIPLPDGEYATNARDVNIHGQVLLNGYNTYAYIYDINTGAMTQLDFGDSTGWGRDINDKGEVVGASYGGTYNYYIKPTYWDAENNRHILEIPEIYVGQAFDINENGYISVSSGYYNNDYYLIKLAKGNTQVGTDVEITTDDGVTLTFDEVTSGGDTTTTTSESNPGDTPQDLRFLGTYYDISTTATFTGNVEVCIPYDDTGLNPRREQNLKLQHYDNGVWIDVTSSIDTENNIVCGTVSHFSWFAVAEKLTPQQQIEILQEFVSSELNLNKGELRSLNSKLDNAIKLLDKGKTKPAINILNAFDNHISAFYYADKITEYQYEYLITYTNNLVLQLT